MAMPDAYSSFRLRAVAASRQKVLDAVSGALGIAKAQDGQVVRLQDPQLASVVRFEGRSWVGLLRSGAASAHSAVLDGLPRASGPPRGCGTGGVAGATARRARSGRMAVP